MNCHKENLFERVCHLSGPKGQRSPGDGECMKNAARTTQPMFLAVLLDGGVECWCICIYLSRLKGHTESFHTQN